MLIGVAGMVGTGKTTLSHALSARFGLQIALESVDSDNPWLESFYGGPEEMRTHGLHLQLHFLATRFASMRRMRGLGGSWILDRTWYEDAEIFARGLFEQSLMTSDEWSLYRRLYAELLHSPAARPPRLLIYLHGPLDVVMGRIATRGRPREREAAPDYWTALHPYSAGGGYVNMMMDEGTDMVKAAYRDNYVRLAQVKATYDPTNLFHTNQNIKPSV